MLNVKSIGIFVFVVLVAAGIGLGVFYATKDETVQTTTLFSTEPLMTTPELQWWHFM